MTHPHSISFESAVLYPLLSNEKEALVYLSECLADDDPRLFLLALKAYVKLHKISMASLAQKTGIQRAKLYRIMSLQGNPEWITINKLIHALGLSLSVAKVS